MSTHTVRDTAELCNDAYRLGAYHALLCAQEHGLDKAITSYIDADLIVTGEFTEETVERIAENLAFVKEGENA